MQLGAAVGLGGWHALGVRRRGHAVGGEHAHADEDMAPDAALRHVGLRDVAAATLLSEKRVPRVIEGRPDWRFGFFKANCGPRPLA